MARFAFEEEARRLDRAALAEGLVGFTGWTHDVWNPFAPGSETSPRRGGGGAWRCGSRIRIHLSSWRGEQVGSMDWHAWASPLACPLR
jgi:hypothetical protein